MPKMTKKSMMMLSLVVFLIFPALIGCSNSPGSNTGSGSTDSGTEAAPDAEAKDPADPLSEAADNKIIEADLAKVETPEYFANSPQYEYTIQLGPTPLSEGTYGQRYFEKKFNVKLKFVNIDESNRKEQLNLMFATGTIPDIVQVALPDVSDYSKQGLLAEIPVEMTKENMPNYYKVIEKYDPQLLSITNVDGKNMGLARFNPNGGVPRPASIRADWLKNVGITKVPQTIQELEDAFVKFRNDDPDQNGAKDTYGMSNPSDFAGNQWFQSIFGAYNTNPFNWVERDGKLQFGLTTPETKEALKLLNKWYKLGLIDPEFITDKGRSSDALDLATKFAQGKLGYIDNLNFDDVQWDNDGHLSFRWVANQPDWQKWFEANKDDKAKLYSTKIYTDFDENAPGPIYITMPPVKGPSGASGYQREGYQNSVLVFGKQLATDQDKFVKLLKIMEYQHTDADAYLHLGYGPEGLMWITDDKGNKLLNTDWPKHELFHPQFKKLGVNWITNIMTWTNPDFMAIWGPQTEQRYELTGDIIREFPYYENQLKVVLPSQGKYTELLDTRVKEYVIKTVTGDLDIDSTFDKTVEQWYKDGGEALTKEANDWYSTVK
ncbi:extracellular solute-binding protein [Paenibacillus sepulcri]|uniref:Extracellular solute-binding protein n=1 Tax=Paenibacillus sepulcri TaxID=359917 RepID=A0ABS7BVH0_9BACL|nr:extracellular solute-binding protein [Paenibacillus sepulcri]